MLLAFSHERLPTLSIAAAVAAPAMEVDRQAGRGLRRLVEQRPVEAVCLRT